MTIKPEIRWLDLSFEPTAPGGEVVFNGVSLEVERPRRGMLQGVFGSRSGTNTRTTGHWQRPPGISRVRWLVGDGELTLTANQTFAILAPTSSGWRATPVDSATIAASGPVTHVTLRIPPPPDDATILGGQGK